MHAVILQKVGIGLDGAEIIDGHDFDVLAVVFDNGTKDEASDAAKAVNCNANSHRYFS